MDYWELRRNHPAFTREPNLSKGTWLNREYDALIAGGLTDDQWYSMSRAARAIRVAHLVGNETIRAAMQYDAAEKAKRDAKNK